VSPRETGFTLAEDRAALTRQVKEASDIVAVVGGYLTLHSAGPVFKALCPFHDDSRPSMNVDPRWQNFRCWACGKKGDVFSFVMEMEKVDFLGAREVLARRANINLEGDAGPDPHRLKLLDAMRWADEQYKECLVDSPLAEQARVYLGERQLAGKTVRDFGLGFAPLSGDWLTTKVRKAGQDWQTLLELGLLSERKEVGGFYERFRDRVMFPIRDMRGQTVGFGGRILPGSPYAARSPKYYNSADTPLFNKSDLLYGIDLARHAGSSEGYLAVMEGYVDVMMAHQHGITNVVATMGTALGARHVHNLRRYVPRVVLVYDADAGGTSGVDRAVDIFISQDVELAIAALPPGLDPCDLLVAQGPEPLKKALKYAVDALDFKLNGLLAREESQGIAGTRRMVDAILAILALAPELPGKAGQLKRELILTRVAHRLGLRLETVWARFGELREKKKNEPARPAAAATTNSQEADAPRAAPAPPLERQLLELVLADPMLVPVAMRSIQPDDLVHPGLKRLLDALYQMMALGEPPELDGLRARIADRALIEWAMDACERGRQITERAHYLNRVLDGFREQRDGQGKDELKSKLSAAAGDHAAALEILRKIQNKPATNDS